jgi:hypothetical protein
MRTSLIVKNSELTLRMTWIDCVCAIVCLFAFWNNFVFTSGVREFHWSLEVTQLLLDVGAITPNHVAFQAFAATMGTFAAAWEHHHVPWRHITGTYQAAPCFSVWATLCTSLRNQGTPRSYRLLQGEPKSANTPTNSIHFACPSDSFLAST